MIRASQARPEVATSGVASGSLCRASAQAAQVASRADLRADLGVLLGASLLGELGIAPFARRKPGGQARLAAMLHRLTTAPEKGEKKARAEEKDEILKEEQRVHPCTSSNYVSLLRDDCTLTVAAAMTINEWLPP
jgi:hypothetical protein